MKFKFKRSCRIYAILFVGFIFSTVYLYQMLPIFISQDSANQLIKNQRIRAAIVYLASNKRIKHLCMSLFYLFTNFNNQFRYPIVIFHFGDLNITDALIEIGKNLSSEQISLINFERGNGKVFPPNFDSERALKEGVVFPFWYPDYNHMCAFWIRSIFLEPYFIRNKIDYFMRIDSDSYILTPIQYDLFEFMQTNQLVYAYRVRKLENMCCSAYFARFLRNYTRDNQITLSSSEILWIESLNETDPASMNPRALDTYYNNFEIIWLPKFRDDARVWNWTEFMWREGGWGIYKHRWGDAFVRFYTVHMFAHLYSRVHHFCDFRYGHGAHRFKPTCSAPRFPSADKHEPDPEEFIDDPFMRP